MKKTYSELVKSIVFYRVLTILLIVFIIFIGVNNISTTKAADMYKEKVDKLERAQIATTDFNEALMVRNDELESANEQLLEFTKLYECKGL